MTTGLFIGLVSKLCPCYRKKNHREIPNLLKALKYLRKKIALANLQNTSLSKSLKKILRTFELHIELDNQFFRRSFLHHFISFEVRCKMLFPKKYFFVRVNLTKLKKSRYQFLSSIHYHYL